MNLKTLVPLFELRIFVFGKTRKILEYCNSNILSSSFCFSLKACSTTRSSLLNGSYLTYSYCLNTIGWSEPFYQNALRFLHAPPNYNAKFFNCTTKHVNHIVFVILNFARLGSRIILSLGSHQYRFALGRLCIS